jgi:hypothetical protein
MAVVQISRIQVRRGKANSGTGFPQLASGEMGWAVDTQELYIGNGSVAEGSPAVGNTKVITQKDLTGSSNILNLIRHIYGVTDPSMITGSSANAPVSRQLQDRLDDHVSVKDFGATGDGSTDDTAAIQRAINELFLNQVNQAFGTNSNSVQRRVTLEFPAGQYITSSTLYVPSYATLAGQGTDKSVILYNSPVSNSVTTAATSFTAYPGIASAARSTTALSGAIGTATITVTSSTGIIVGMNVIGFGIATGATVTVIVGTTITLSANNTAGVTGSIQFGTNALTVTSTTGLSIGQYVFGTGIATNATITGIVGSVVTMNYAVTGALSLTMSAASVAPTISAYSTSTTTSIAAGIGDAVLNLSSTAGLYLGLNVVSSNLLPNTIITSIGANNTIVLNQLVPSYTLAASATTTSSNTITVSTITGLAVGMPIKFSGTTFGNIIAGNSYYVYSIPDSTHIQVTASPGGMPFALTSASGTMSVIAGGIALNDTITFGGNLGTAITVSSATNIAVGMSVTGTGVTAGSIVNSINGTTLILNNALSGTPSGHGIFGANAITVASATSLYVGETVSGTGIASGATITNLTGSSIALSLANTGPVTGSITATITSTEPVMQFINDTSTIGYPSLLASTVAGKEPRRITVRNLTVQTINSGQAGLQLDCVKESLFEHVRVIGNWGGIYNAGSIGITLNALSSLVTCKFNQFEDVAVSGFSYGIVSQTDVVNNIFRNGYFTNLRQGFVLGTTSNGSTPGQQYGPTMTYVINSRFENIKQQAFYVGLGSGNTIENCRLVNVGDNGGGNATAQYPQIYFGSTGNAANQNQSDRSNDLAVPTSLSAVPYYPEVAGTGIYRSYGIRKITIGQTTPYILAFRLPVNTDALGNPNGAVVYQVDYIYRSTTNYFTKQGKLSISADITDSIVQLSDEFTMAGNDPTYSNALSLDFRARFLDATGNTYTGAAGQVPTIIAVNYANPLSGDSGTLSYSYIATM